MTTNLIHPFSVMEQPSGPEVWHLSLNKAVLQRFWDCIFGKWRFFVFVCGYVCLSVCLSACLLIRTRGYSELCFALILCRSLFMERHTPTRIHSDNQCAKTTLHQRTWTSLFVTTDENQGLQGQQMSRNMCAHTSKCLLLHGQRSFGHRSETVPHPCSGESDSS